MKTVDQLKPNFAPCYAAAMYPGLSKIFHEHGYALAVHGSLARDLDLVAVPWAEKVSTPNEVLGEVERTFCVNVIGGIVKGGDIRNHGRVAYQLSVGFGDCGVDLSFFPFVQNNSCNADR